MFASREFRFLYSAFALSLIGDQLARIALSIFVYQRTSSALLTAVTYTMSYVPWVLGGPTLSALADRLPRRQVMITCDLLRMVIIALIAVPGMPLAAMISLLFFAYLFEPPFRSARAALTPEILEGDRYIVGNALIGTTTQLCMAIGFLAGGALVAVLTARGVVLIDAATFLVSAVLLAAGVLARPRPPRDEAAMSTWRELTAGGRLVFHDRRLRSILLVVWATSSFGFAWEGIAAPWAHQLGGGAKMVGLFLGLDSLAMVVGSIVIGRLCPPPLRRRLMLPLAIVAPLLLALVLPFAGLAVALIAVTTSAFAQSYNLPLNAAYVRAVPAPLRGRAFGIAQGGIQASTGIGVLIAGVMAETLAPSTTVGILGLVGTVVVLPIALHWPADARG